MQHIIELANSELGVAIAWIATVLSLALAIWAMFTKQTIKVENINLKQTIQTLKQELNNKEVNQIGKNNSYIEKNKGGVHFN